MDAPTETVLLESSLRAIPLTWIRPSHTAIQTRRRQHFDAGKLAELTESVKAQGILQPILVRPFGEYGSEHWPDGGVPVSFEIVAGERRYLAAERAGLKEIDCNVRTLTDAQVIEAQLVENLQRADVHPLEEAEGFRELLALQTLTPEAIGALIGKSRAYVYARLKLLDLCPEARAALDTGALDASKALLISRISSAKLQQKALKVITEQSWRGEPMSYKRAFALLRENILINLATAPFPLEGATLFRFEKVPGRRGHEEAIALPECAGCPCHSANDPELQRDLAPGARVCTDPACFEAKTAAWSERVLKTASAAGTPIVEGDDAKQIAPRRDKLVGFVDLDVVCGDDGYDLAADPEPQPATPEEEASADFQAKLDAWQARYDAHCGRTYRQLLGAEHGLPITLLKDPKTRCVRELVPFKATQALLKKQHQIGLPAWLAAPEPKRSAPATPETDWREEQRKREERHAREKAWRAYLLAAIAPKCAGPLKRDEIVDLADHLIERDRYAIVEGLKPLYGKIPEPAHLKDAELGKFIRLALVASDVARTGGAPSALLALAKRYKLDLTKLKKAFAAETKPDDKPAAAKPAKKKK
jgi:ParB/RepB/Spo0J family partition protein